jgi:hypothetical protein
MNIMSIEDSIPITTAISSKTPNFSTNSKRMSVSKMAPIAPVEANFPNRVVDISADNGEASLLIISKYLS